MDLLSTTFNWVVLHWPQLLALVGGSAGLSVVLEFVLRKLHVDSKKLAFTLLQVLGFVSSLAVYFISSIPSSDVPAIFGTLVIVAQAWHRFVISPAYTSFIEPFLEWKAGQKDTAPQTPVNDPISVINKEAEVNQFK